MTHLDIVVALLPIVLLRAALFFVHLVVFGKGENMSVVKSETGFLRRRVIPSEEVVVFIAHNIDPAYFYRYLWAASKHPICVGVKVCPPQASR